MHQSIQLPERTGAGQKTGDFASFQQTANPEGFV
jgi:hypothetical protein